MRTWFFKFWSDRSGATAIEYGLIAFILSVGIIGTVINLEDQVVRLYETTSAVMAEVNK